METNGNKPINETSIEQWIEEIRSSYAHMLKVHLQLYRRHDQFMSDVKDEKLKQFYRTGQPYHEENGKINWEIIHQFMPPDMKKRLEEKYSMLNEHEIRLCCLLFFNVSDKTIADILSYNQKSIRSMKYVVKHKTGIRDIREMFRKIIVKSM